MSICQNSIHANDSIGVLLHLETIALVVRQAVAAAEPQLHVLDADAETVIPIWNKLLVIESVFFVAVSVMQAEIERNYNQIKADVKQVVAEELTRIADDPDLQERRIFLFIGIQNLHFLYRLFI
ncbi:hypothetical protein [Viscerimonas tarda]